MICIYVYIYITYKWCQFNCESYILFHQGPTWTKNLQWLTAILFVLHSYILNYKYTGLSTIVLYQCIHNVNYVNVYAHRIPSSGVGRTASAIDGRRAHWRQVLLCKICTLCQVHWSNSLSTIWIKGDIEIVRRKTGQWYINNF